MNASLCNELLTIGDFIRWAASQFNGARLFFGHGTDNAIDEAIYLVLHALHLPHTIPEPLWYTRLTTQEKQVVLQIVQQRLYRRIPAAYLTNEAWFAGLRFYVDQRVLIPRSPIAELIEQRFSPWIEADEIERVLDLCTGSGCIAIATALTLPSAEIDATDISQEALAVAQRNINDYELTQQVHAIQSDLFAQLGKKRYDVIVCNPPYVALAEWQTLPAEYRHEPRLGLTAGEDGLYFVNQILQQAAPHLTAKGILIVEVGTSQTALEQRYPEVPFTWLEFERGGEGVFLLTLEQLKAIVE